MLKPLLAGAAVVRASSSGALQRPTIRNRDRENFRRRRGVCVSDERAGACAMAADRLRGALWGLFAGDALASPTHWRRGRAALETRLSIERTTHVISAEYTRRSRGVAATRPQGLSASQPRRRRDSSPRTVRVVAAVSRDSPPRSNHVAAAAFAAIHQRKIRAANVTAGPSPS